MTLNFEVRLAKLSDLSELLNLLPQIRRGLQLERIDEKVARVSLEKMLTSKQQFLYVCEYDGRIVSTAEFLLKYNLTHKARPYGYIENVVTDINYENKGFGTRVVGACVSAARELNCYKCLLTCQEDPKLLHFYGKFGFKKFPEIVMRLNFE